jgi:hypothetical protein
MGIPIVLNICQYGPQTKGKSMDKLIHRPNPGLILSAVMDPI